MIPTLKKSIVCIMLKKILLMPLVKDGKKDFIQGGTTIMGVWVGERDWTSYKEKWEFTAKGQSWGSVGKKLLRGNIRQE